LTPSILIRTGVAVGRCYLVTKNPEIAVGVKCGRVIDLLTSPSKVKEKDRCLARSRMALTDEQQPWEHTVAGQRLILTGLPCCDMKKLNSNESEFTHVQLRGQALA